MITVTSNLSILTQSINSSQEINNDDNRKKILSKLKDKILEYHKKHKDKSDDITIPTKLKL